MHQKAVAVHHEVVKLLGCGCFGSVLYLVTSSYVVYLPAIHPSLQVDTENSTDLNRTKIQRRMPPGWDDFPGQHSYELLFSSTIINWATSKSLNSISYVLLFSSTSVVIQEYQSTIINSIVVILEYQIGASSRAVNGLNILNMGVYHDQQLDFLIADLYWFSSSGWQ